MASTSKITRIPQFRGINEKLAPDLLELGDFVELQNLIGDKGKLVQTAPLAEWTNDVLGFGGQIKLIKKVVISETSKNRFSGSFNGRYAYLVLSGVQNAYLVNPEDPSDTIPLQIYDHDIVPMDPLATSSRGGADTNIFITGVENGTLTNLNDHHAVYFVLRNRENPNTTVTLVLDIYDARGIYDNVNTEYFPKLDSIDLHTLSHSRPETINFDLTVNGVSTELKLHLPNIINYSLQSTRIHAYFRLGLKSNTGPATGRFTEDQLRAIATWDEPVSYCVIGNHLYFSWYNRIYYFNGDVIMSAGSGNTYGKFVANYYNHLFVGQVDRETEEADLFGYIMPARGPDIPYENIDRKYTLAWSDLGEPNDFLFLFDSEADQFILEQELTTNPNMTGITGLAKFNDKLYVFTEQSVYEISYVGLPLVMQIRNLYATASCVLPHAVVSTPYGIVTLASNWELQLFNGVETESLGGVDFELLGINSLRNLGNSDFLSTYKDTRFPGYLRLNYDAYLDELIVSYYVKSSAIDADTYNLKLFRLRYVFSSRTWYRQYLGGDKIVAQPYSAIEYPCLDYTNVLSDPQQHYYILGDKNLITYDSNSKTTTLSSSDVIQENFGGTLTDKTTKIIFTPGYFLEDSSNYFGHLNSVELELYGTGLVQIKVVLTSWDDTTRDSIKSEVFSKSVDLASSAKPIIRIGRRVKHFQLTFELEPSVVQLDVRLNNILINTVGTYKDVQS